MLAIFETRVTHSQLFSHEIGKMHFFAFFGSQVERFATHSRLIHRWALKSPKRLRKFHGNFFRDSSRDSPNRKTPKNSFLKGFSWVTYFKPLPSSLKPIFQYFYIKTQPIWMVFHSINISKVILHYFHWFWSLDYVLESFCVLGWEFHHRGREHLIFIKFFVWDLFLLMICFWC